MRDIKGHNTRSFSAFALTFGMVKVWKKSMSFLRLKFVIKIENNNKMVEKCTRSAIYKYLKVWFNLSA